MTTATPDRLDVPIDQDEPDGLYEVIDGRIVEKTIGVTDSRSPARQVIDFLKERLGLRMPGVGLEHAIESGLGGGAPT
jgi:hypothetical protein